MGHVRRKRKNNKHITDTKVYTFTYGSSEFSVRGVCCRRNVTWKRAGASIARVYRQLFKTEAADEKNKKKKKPPKTNITTMTRFTRRTVVPIFASQLSRRRRFPTSSSDAARARVPSFHPTPRVPRFFLLPFFVSTQYTDIPSGPHTDRYYILSTKYGGGVAAGFH